MTYTQTQQFGAFHQTRITPLDPATVCFVLTVKVPHFPTQVSSELLSLYAALALTKTKSKDKKAIETYVRQYGMSLKIEAGIGSLSYRGCVRSEHVPKLVTLLKEILTSIEIDATEFTLKKKLALEDNRESRDDAKRIAQIAFSNLLYDRESFMREATLDEEKAAITATKIRDLVALTAIIPKGEWFFSLVGAPESESQFNSLTAFLKKQATFVPRHVQENRSLSEQYSFITVPGKTNVEVRIGNLLPISSDHEAFVPLEFGLMVLGKAGGFSGRLMSTVREKEGLTYGIYARIVTTHRLNTGHWNIYTFFTAQDLHKGIEATKRELGLIVQKGITLEELHTFKEISHNQYILSHESNRTRLNYYHNVSLLGYSEPDMAKIYKRINTLTVDVVNEALRTYIDPNNLIVVGAGPVRENGTGIITVNA